MSVDFAIWPVQLHPCCCSKGGPGLHACTRWARSSSVGTCEGVEGQPVCMTAGQCSPDSCWDQWPVCCRARGRGGRRGHAAAAAAAHAAGGAGGLRYIVGCNMLLGCGLLRLAQQWLCMELMEAQVGVALHRLLRGLGAA